MPVSYTHLDVYKRQEVVGSITTGSHEMFAGKILKVHADAELVRPDGSIDFGKADLL